MLRRCTKCGTEHPATTDYFLRAQQGRLRGDCRACTSKNSAEYYRSHRAKHLAATRRWIKAHPETRRAISKRYRERHRAKCKAAVAAWFTKDPEHARAVNRAKSTRWYRRHLDRARAIRRAGAKKRKALKRGALIATLSRQEWDAIKALYDHSCAYCGRHKRLTQDHVIPLTNGGDHTAKNVVPACVTCNCRKKAGPPPVPVTALKFLTASH